VVVEVGVTATVNGLPPPLKVAPVFRDPVNGAVPVVTVIVRFVALPLHVVAFPLMDATGNGFTITTALPVPLFVQPFWSVRLAIE
jgi:hypothetical protein